MIPCILWVFRTSIMGTALALMTFFFFKYKIKSLPVIFGIVLLIVIAIFTIPSMKAKMFKDGNSINIAQLQQGKISKDDINSNARFALWEHLQKRFYHKKEVIGSGTGSVQNYMYSNFVFGGLHVPHNDYIQISCDNGLIGIVLYLLIIVSIITHCFIEYNKKNSTTIKMCAIVAGSSIAGVALTMPLFREMRKNPRVAAVKNSSMPVQDIQMFKMEGGEGFVVFNGPDEQLVSGLAMGADGGIGGTYAVMPELYLKIKELTDAGKVKEASEIQYVADAIIYAMCECHGNLYAVMKEILRIRENLNIGGVRKPLPEIIPEDMEQIKKCAGMIDEAIKKYC